MSARPGPIARMRAPAPELAGIEVRGTTRAAFLMKGALATGAAYGLMSVGPFVREALGQQGTEFSDPSFAGEGDVEILNFALTLEYLEWEYYARALRQVNLGSEARELVTEIRDNEREHIDFLIGAVKSLKGKPGRAPEVTFDFGGEEAFLALAQTFEDTGVMAYNGAGPLLESKAVLNNAGRIVQVEGRHAGAIRWLRGQNVTDGALDGVLNFQEVVERVEPFIIDSPQSFREPPSSGSGL